MEVGGEGDVVRGRGGRAMSRGRVVAERTCNRKEAVAATLMVAGEDVRLRQVRYRDGCERARIIGRNLCGRCRQRSKVC